MMDVLSASDLIRLFEAWKQLFVEQRDYLISLDGKVCACFNSQKVAGVQNPVRLQASCNYSRWF